VYSHWRAQTSGQYVAPLDQGATKLFDKKNSVATEQWTVVIDENALSSFFNP
jgi:hypothetical protein